MGELFFTGVIGDAGFVKATCLTMGPSPMSLGLMSQALFSVIGGTLVNLAKVNAIENSTTGTDKVIVWFENKEKLVLDGSVEAVLLKIGGGSKRDMDEGLGKR